jgi:hypothetical protein
MNAIDAEAINAIPETFTEFISYFEFFNFDVVPKLIIY